MNRKIIPVFLIGGGWRAETFPQTYGRFLQSATRKGQKRIAVIVAEEPDTDSHVQFLRFYKAFQAVGLNYSEANKIVVSAHNPLTTEKLAETDPTGVFVCGGLTPAYFEGLCLDRSWLKFLEENQTPYGGFSAGAAIAAKQAIIGGWRRNLDNRIVEITNENAGEDLDLLTVRDGLGLVPFAVDVHATQWGTLSRLIHAVKSGSAQSGWAIDENTMLEINQGEITVHGEGNAYYVEQVTNKISIEVINQK